ncbi:MAG: TonB-dependent siderophore receptor [Rhizobiales bacterium 24-66-13]|jgi:iron complex outermembrane receptor protein|nr:MAG: TonB-dependent siderophore receptor [Rhizobiales bacterium 35-66-30]OYZ76405.1 MAG: TonB-dependent siderophore receptor [Rhizobiales bacterium 24-66-13]OZB03338.1 MAG: TonB-dependent siderophore receptor [Rhizobiales bacterium 39-66-18]HQS47081.1 TonB-dependent siderophore receptor [Xanthobacteraceae bacterium]
MIQPPAPRGGKRLCAALLLATTPALAQNALAQNAVELPEITVQDGGAGSLLLPQIQKLKIPNETGSLVGLTPFETPAAIDIVTQQEMQERGLNTLTEVYNTVPGVMAGNLPGEPGVTSMRGFSRGAVGYSVDGMQVPDPLLVSRNYDSFSFDRVEILKGPASVVSGNGALAGSINLVTKQPSFERNFGQAIGSIGSFDTYRVGADYNVVVNPNLALRASGIYSQSNGYIDDTGSTQGAFTLGATVKLTDRLTNTTSVDYFHDDYETPYQGAPLIARSAALSPSNIVSAPGGLVIDEALRNKNYNVYNGEMSSTAWWVRNRTDYELNDDWTVRNDFNYYTASRVWANSEDFTYNAATGLLNRSTTYISHDQNVWSDRVAALYDGQLWGMRHRFAAGVEYIDTTFYSQRRFGNTTPVSPYFPARGYFPADTAANFPTRQDYDSQVGTAAVFTEDAVNITDKWLVVGGIRYENIQLDRQIFNLNTNGLSTFDNTYDSVSWRVGTVYNILPETALYAQYNQATVPISSLLLSNLANSQFELSYGNSIEAGIKSAMWDNRVVTTASIYKIEQYNILTRDPLNPALTVQGGSQRSRGAEAEIAVALTDRWKVMANVSYINAEFTQLYSASANLAGNRPPNVPELTYMFLTSYRFERIPLTVSGSLQYVSSFYTDTANTIEVQGRTVFDAWLDYEVGKGTVRLRGKNLTNEFYADWSGYSATQVYIAPPRSFELSYAVKF